MKESRRCLLLLFAVAILGIGVPWVASADPVIITSGVISVPAGLSLSSPIQLEGTDGVRPFSLVGFISPDSNIGVRSCTPCLLTDTMMSLVIRASGQDLVGTLTNDGDGYHVGGLNEIVGSVSLDITGFALLPPLPSMTTELATITGPFQLGFGSSWVPPISGGPSHLPGNSLRGSGLATVSLFAEDTGHGVLHWSLRSAEYQFAPTPEPASFVLLGSGLIGVASGRRRRDLVRHP